MRKQTKRLNRIKIPRTVKKEDLKLYVSFCAEHVKETDTPEDIEERWQKFKKSLRDAVKGIVRRSKENS